MRNIVICILVSFLLLSLFVPLFVLVKADNTNLAPINDGNWFTDEGWASCPTQNVFYDTSTTHNGAPTFRVETANSVNPPNPWDGGVFPGNWGADHGAIDLKPGDYVIIKGWIKTSGSAADSGTGARFGLDYYHTAGGVWQRICGINSQTDAQTGTGYPNSDHADIYTNFVPWGTGWTFKQWDFIVPAQALSDLSPQMQPLSSTQNQIGTGQWASIGAIIPWVMIYGQNGWANTYTSWFSDFKVFVNP